VIEPTRAGVEARSKVSGLDVSICPSSKAITKGKLLPESRNVQVPSHIPTLVRSVVKDSVGRVDGEILKVPILPWAPDITSPVIAIFIRFIPLTTVVFLPSVPSKIRDRRVPQAAVIDRVVGLVEFIRSSVLIYRETGDVCFSFRKNFVARLLNFF
jgi:hypothetical protein